ncbi:MAG: DUF2797 domain-containing protein [Calditrichaeota bacterium]|nr:MAG: DUF2797 domain-containing protein [Calditrichota bacterium]
MTEKGVLIKMSVRAETPVQYTLNLNDHPVLMNNLIGQTIQIRFSGYQCLSCGATRKIFRQGYCYDCFYKQPDVGEWVIRPELSKAHLGLEDRDLAYEKEAQLQPHVVYLAESGGAKVGVTRKSQIPTRWIDQGASRAVAIVETPNRYLAGITEVALKKHISDKTNWRRMLKNEQSGMDLMEIRKRLLDFVPEEARPYILSDTLRETHIDYPVTTWPSRVVSLNLSKTPEYSGTLSGIRGQYLMFTDHTVFNIRSNEGTVIELTWPG